MALRNLDDPSKYKSAEFAAVGVDELTRQDYDIFNILRGSMRWPGVKNPRFVAASNPGGLGHLWVCDHWDVSKRRPQNLPREIVRKGLAPEFAFVRALPSDNPHLDEAYWDMLETLPEYLAKAWRWGDWDAISGAMFDWRPDIDGKPWHVVPTDKCPKGLEYHLGIDYGFNAPWAAYLMGFDYDGYCLVCRERYGKGVKASEQALSLAKMVEDVDTSEPIPAYAGFDVYAAQRGAEGRMEPIVEIWETTLLRHYGDTPPIHFIESGRDPLARACCMREYLSDWGATEAWPDGKPGLQVMECCTNLIQTLPILEPDENRVDVVNTKMDDHCLVGSTLVDTSRGQIPIAELVGTTGEVLTADGEFHPYSDVKITMRAVPVYRILFEDSRSIAGTADHPVLTDKGWVPILCLDPGSRVVDVGRENMIQLAISKHTEANCECPSDLADDSGVPGSPVLQMRPVLSEERGETTQSCVGTLQWPDSEGLSCSPQERKGRQFPGEPTTQRTTGAFEGCFARTSRGKAEAYVGVGATQGRRVASVGGRQAVPPMARQKKLGEQETDEEGLRYLRGRLRNALSRAFQLLQPTMQKCSGETEAGYAPPKLGGGKALPAMRQALRDLLSASVSLLQSPMRDRRLSRAQTCKVVRVEFAGIADVYNMDVPAAHDFSVVGGLIVHNSFDSVGHVLTHRPGKPERQPAPKADKSARQRVFDEPQEELPVRDGYEW